jgi:hypothetical protein
MSTTAVTYPIEETSKNLPFDGSNAAKANQAYRTIKVAYPDHPECMGNGQNMGWWKECLKRGHNPFVTLVDATVEEKVYEEREDGARILIETREVTQQIERLNITQVVYESWADGGRSLEKVKAQNGFRLIDELGYPHMCELANCFLPARVKGPYGSFCTDAHARQVGLYKEHKVVEIYDQQVRRQQYNALAPSR